MGFKPTPFAEINREERHYCAVLMHTLLASEVFRSCFAELVSGRIRRPLDPGALEVFVEPAVLRDYWFDLGPSKPLSAYLSHTHELRRGVVLALLERHGWGEDKLNLDLFWTKTPRLSKLRFPGNWSSGAIASAVLDHPDGGLNRERTAFKAIPDMLLSSPGSAVFLEAKLYSPEGKDPGGYLQFDNLRTITSLVADLVPAFAGSCEPVVLSLKAPPLSTGEDERIRTISWKEVAAMALESGPPDAFSAKTFRRLLRVSG